MSNGNAQQSAWSDRHHNGEPMDWEDRLAMYDGADAGSQVLGSDFDSRVPSPERVDRAEREWLRRVIDTLGL